MKNNCKFGISILYARYRNYRYEKRGTMRKYYFKVCGGFGEGYLSIRYKTKIFGFIPWCDEIHKVMFRDYENDSPEMAIRNAKKIVKELNEFEKSMREVSE